MFGCFHCSPTASIPHSYVAFFSLFGRCGRRRRHMKNVPPPKRRTTIPRTATAA